ncbi:hypothetical protein [Nostoc sp.]|uniref:hypothetical protein n=1 Tax=Nostoc sp. TaxID=1180 RepID=UPI002FF560E8
MENSIKLGFDRKKNPPTKYLEFFYSDRTLHYPLVRSQYFSVKGERGKGKGLNFPFPFNLSPDQKRDYWVYPKSIESGARI